MPHAPNLNGPVNGTTVPLKLHIPEPNGTNGAFLHAHNGTNGLFSPPLILDTNPKRPPKPPVGRVVLPMKKSKTLPIHFEESAPASPPTTLLNGKKLFVTKPLNEVHTIPSVQDNGSYSSSILNRSPSPLYRRSNSSASVETGSIAELARRHVPHSYLVSRSPSPLSYKSCASNYSTCSSNGTYVPLSRSSSINSTIYNRTNNSTPTPRRMYPQTYDSSENVDLRELRAKEQAPVIFDANLSFVLGVNKQPMRQRFTPIAAHLEEGTSSNHLSSKIDNFLKRTDHVMDEWRRLGHRDEPDLDCYYGSKRKLGRSKSATNIMIKGFTLFSRSGSRASSVCRSSRGISEDPTTASELEEVCYSYLVSISTFLFCLRRSLRLS